MRICTRGLGAHDLDVEITDNTVLSAPSESGKSSCLNAIRLAALGYIPQQGKTLEATARLMRGEGPMSVTLTLDDGRAMTRTLARVGKKLTMSATASWLLKAGTEEVSSAILALFGPSEAVVAQLLDARELTSLTGPQRAARIEQLIASTADATEQFRLVGRLIVKRLLGLKELPPNAQKIIDGGAIPAPVVAEMAVSAPMLRGKLKDGLPSAILWAREKANEAHRRMDEYKKALKAKTAQCEGLPTVCPQEIADLDTERSRLEQELGAIRERNRDGERQVRAQREAAQAMTAAETAMAAARDSAEQWEAHGAGELTAKRARLTALEDEQSELQPPPISEIPGREIRAEIAETEHKRDEIQLPDVPDTQEQQQTVDRLKRQLAAVGESPWSIVAIRADEIAGMSAGNSERVRRLREIADELRKLAVEHAGGDKQAIELQLGDAIMELEAALKAQRDAALKRGRAYAAREKLDLSIAQLRERLGTIEAQAAREYRAAHDAYASRARTIRVEIDTARNAIRALETREKHVAQVTLDAQRQHDRARDRAAETAGYSAELESTASVEAELSAVRERIEQLSTTAEAHRERARLEGVVVEREAAWRVYSATESACATVRDERTAASGGPLAELMVRALSGMGRAERPYFAAGGEIGWVDRAGNKVQVSALSGLGWTYYAAALMGAMICREGGEIRILPVEAAEVESGWDERPDALTALLRGISALDSELRGISIVNIPRPIGDVPAGWRVERFERRAIERAA